jgi:pimeloyl-ACP methyl ester carboxylesterase
MADEAWQPVSLELPDGRAIAGLGDAAQDEDFVIILLHEKGRDLDQSLPLLCHLPAGGARRLALDLPGHGLSGDARDDADAEAMLALALDALSGPARRPLVLATLGDGAPLGWRLAAHPAVIGLGLISPRVDAWTAPRLPSHLSLIGFVAQRDARGVDDWTRLRRAAGCRWLGVSMVATHEEMLDAEGPATGQVASHLSGFAREAFALTVQAGE